MATYDNFVLEGMDELEDAIKELKELVGPDAAHGLVQGSAELMEGAVRENMRFKDKTGNLRKAVVLRKGRVKGVWIVAIDRAIAPHAHLVEYGHGGPQPAPAHPFFRPAIDQASGAAVKQIEDAIRKAILG